MREADQVNPDVCIQGAGIAVEALLRAMPFPVCLVDPDLRILYAEWPWARHAREGEHGFCSVVGTSLLDQLDEPDRSHLEGVARNVLAMAEMGGAAGWEEVEVSAHSEGGQDLHVSAVPVLDDDGHAAGVLFVGCSPDSSAPHVEREAARLDVARQLAATLNHEINNPLFVISATLEDLLAEARDTAQERRLHAALDAVWRVSSAVKQLSEIRQLISTAYIGGRPMIDLQASQEPPAESAG